MKRFLSIFLATAAIGLAAVPAEATLIDRGSGLIYDTDLNITWLADANYANTTGYDNALYGTDTNGRMHWADAVAWADQLVYGGYSEWRLPTTLQPDPSASAQVDSNHDGIPDFSWGYNGIGSEMGHLFYTELGGTANVLISRSTDSDIGLFTNLQTYVYWSSTEYSLFTSFAWDFNFGNGYLGLGCKRCNVNALAVRDGDVAGDGAAPVPEPGTMMLMGSGLVGLIAARKRFSRRHG